MYGMFEEKCRSEILATQPPVTISCLVKIEAALDTVRQLCGSANQLIAHPSFDDIPVLLGNTPLKQ